jgi:hypothetical protein
MSKRRERRPVAVEQQYDPADARSRRRYARELHDRRARSPWTTASRERRAILIGIRANANGFAADPGGASNALTLKIAARQQRRRDPELRVGIGQATAAHARMRAGRRGPRPSCAPRPAFATRGAGWFVDGRESVDRACQVAAQRLRERPPGQRIGAGFAPRARGRRYGCAIRVTRVAALVEIESGSALLGSLQA